MAEKIYFRLERIEQLLTEQHAFSKPFLSLEESAQYLGLSMSAMYKLTSSGKLVHYKPNGKMIFCKKEDLDAWALSNRQKTQSEIREEAVSLLKGRSVA